MWTLEHMFKCMVFFLGFQGVSTSYQFSIMDEYYRWKHIRSFINMNIHPKYGNHVSFWIVNWRFHPWKKNQGLATWYSFGGIDVKIWQIFPKKKTLTKWHMVSCGSMHYALFIIGYPHILGVLRLSIVQHQTSCTHSWSSVNNVPEKIKHVGYK